MSEMNRSLPALVAVVALLVAGAVPAAAFGMAATDTRSTLAGPTAATNDTANATDENATIAPGTRLAGTVSNQGAELEGEVERRSFGLAVAAAHRKSANASATVVSNNMDRLTERLERLRAQRDRLLAEREAGNVSENAYQARATSLAARTEQLREMVNATEREANDLPPQARKRANVNATRLHQMRSEADELTGPEVAGIARQVAGPPGQERDRNRGPDGDRGPSGDQDPGDERGPPGERTDDGTDVTTEAPTGTDEPTSTDGTETSSQAPTTATKGGPTLNGTTR